MIDPKLVTQQPAAVKASLVKRHQADMLMAVDVMGTLNRDRSEHLQGRDRGRAAHKELSNRIGAAYKAGNTVGALQLKQSTVEVAAVIAEHVLHLNRIEDERHSIAMHFPNILDPEVPEGKSESANLVLATVGTPAEFTFEPESHVEIGTRLGILDLDRAAKLSGSRFWVLRGKGAKLERALISYFLDQAEANGHTEVLTPYIVHREMLEGTGQLPKFEHDVFKLAEPLNGSEAFLIPTGEVPITNLHRDEIVGDLLTPIRYVGFTPCFRAEAGTHGKDVRGLIRVHQFHKVEMVWITRPEDSAECLDQMVDMAGMLLENLGLPYRKVLLCGGDTGFSANKTFDLEVWLPSQGAYREISSVSNFGDFQARRMSLRYRVKGQKKPRLAHTLNGSALAVGRTLVAILENGQQEDGSVVLPDALVPYMGTKVLLP